MAQEAWNPSSPLESAFLFNGQTRSLFQGINDNAAWYPQHQPQSQQQDRGLVMLFSPEGQVLKINFQNAKEYLGAGFGEQLFGRTGLQVDSLFHYEDLPGILQGFEELDQHHPRVLDVRMVTDFGRYQWMHVRLTLRPGLKEGDQVVIALHCLRMDGPEEYLDCGDELRVSAFSAHMNSSFQFVFVSPASLPIFGAPPSSLLGHRFLDFIPEEDHEFFHARVAEAQAPGASHVLFNIMFQTPGGLVPVIATLFCPQGQPQGTCLCTIGLNTPALAAPPNSGVVPGPVFMQPAQPQLVPNMLPHAPYLGYPALGLYGESPFQTQPPTTVPPTTISPMMTVSADSSTASITSEPSSSDSPSSKPVRKTSTSSPQPVKSLKLKVAKRPSLPSPTSSVDSIQWTSSSMSVAESSSSSGASSPSSSKDSDSGASEPKPSAASLPPKGHPKWKHDEIRVLELIHEGPVKKKKKKKSVYRRSKRTDIQCEFCGKSESPEWRRGPSGPNSLCNACGIKYSKKGLPTPNGLLRRASGGGGSELVPKAPSNPPEASSAPPPPQKAPEDE